MADEDLRAELEKLKAENERLKGQRGRTGYLKVSEKGGVSVYGLGRFPVTLYKEQWAKLLAMADDARAAGVDIERGQGIALATLDVGHGGTVDDPLRTRGVHGVHHHALVTNVGAHLVDRNDVVGCERRGHIAAELTADPEDRDLHGRGVRLVLRH